MGSFISQRLYFNRFNFITHNDCCLKAILYKNIYSQFNESNDCVYNEHKTNPKLNSNYTVFGAFNFIPDILILHSLYITTC